MYVFCYLFEQCCSRFFIATNGGVGRIVYKVSFTNQPWVGSASRFVINIAFSSFISFMACSSPSTMPVSRGLSSKQESMIGSMHAINALGYHFARTSLMKDMYPSRIRFCVGFPNAKSWVLRLIVTTSACQFEKSHSEGHESCHVSQNCRHGHSICITTPV